MVVVATNIKQGQKELKRDWPIEEGLTAGTTKQEGTKAMLEATDGTLVKREIRQGLD